MRILQTDPQTQRNYNTQPHKPILQHATDTRGGGQYTRAVAIVTNSEVSFSSSEVNSSPSPFSRGQLVRIVKTRHSRRKYQGKFGEVVTVVRGGDDAEWTIYVAFPGRNQAVAFYPSELALILESGCLVGGAA